VSVVLDASALLALLWGEPGSARVRAVLHESAISTVNLSEVVAKFADDRADEADVRTMLNLPVRRIEFDEDLAYVAGLLVPMTRRAGLSFGDRACLALARRLKVPAMTADRPWASLSGAVGVEIEVIR
jgi:PIN domain nuclease of toxin-antitoxin system